MQLRACVVMFAIGASSSVGCHNDPPPPESELVPVVRHRAPPPPLTEQPTAPPAIDLALGAGFEMRRPIRDGRLTLIPIIAVTPAAVPATRFLTLQDGMARGLVTVSEVRPEFEVDTVILRNRSKQPLFVLQGELLLEGEQDRALAESRVIPPGATVQLAARCVEAERDSGSPAFRPGNALAELSLRRAIAHESQDNVWGQVDIINRRLHLDPPTKTYRHAAAAQRKGTAATRRAELARQLGGLEERGQIVGMAVVIDGEVVAVDRFATPELYRQLEAQLLGAYVMDNEGAAPFEDRPLGPNDVRAFIASAKPMTTDASFIALRERPRREQIPRNWDE